MSHVAAHGWWPAGWLAALAAGLALLAFELYRRQLGGRAALTAVWGLAGLRSLSVFIVVMTLAEPVLVTQSRSDRLTRLTFLIDASASMAQAPYVLGLAPSMSANPPQPHRFERGVQLLCGSGGWLQTLSDRFELRVIRLDGPAETLLWDDRQSPPLDAPLLRQSWTPREWASTTALGEGLAPWLNSASADGNDANAAAKPKPQTAAASADSAEATDASEVVVLFSDGINHSGRDPLEVARELRHRGVRLYTLGLGPPAVGGDLELVELQLPERLYRSDTLHGTIRIAQHQAAGLPFQVQLEHEGQTLWQKTLTATAAPQRELPFSIAVEPLLAHTADSPTSEVQVLHRPLKFTARLHGPSSESNPQNNNHDAYTRVELQKSRVLLIDGRSRWETRYLKNLFQRAPGWEVQAVLLGTTTSPPTGSPAAASLWLGSADSLPVTSDQLSEFDLIILGEVEASAVPDKFWNSLREYVEVAGGGLVVIDGPREHLQDAQLHDLHRMLPVRWLERSPRIDPSRGGRFPIQPQPTAAGQALDALLLSPEGAAESLKLWSDLPPVQFIAPVAALPGAEVLLEAVTPVERFPLLVSRRYAAGRVLYLASDETWRWRYDWAEPLHGQLWMQLARWVMRLPYSLRNAYLALDVGAGIYSPQQSIPVRCQLQTASGQPASGLMVAAVVSQAAPSGQPPRPLVTVPLTEGSIPGDYTGQFGPLPGGDYQVHIAAPGFSAAALELRAPLAVKAAANPELRQVALDEVTLRSLAEATGGEYLPESRARALLDLLQPHVQGKIDTAVWQVWQSWGWFTAVVALLSMEWIIRKRIGLN